MHAKSSSFKLGSNVHLTLRSNMTFDSKAKALATIISTVTVEKSG